MVGWEADPFRGQAEIILRGTHASPAISLNSGPNIGSKALGKAVVDKYKECNVHSAMSRRITKCRFALQRCMLQRYYR